MFNPQVQGSSQKSIKNGGKNGGVSLNPELMQLKNIKESERQEREGIVLWKRPLTTLHYFIVELYLNIIEYTQKYIFVECKTCST